MLGGRTCDSKRKPTNGMQKIGDHKFYKGNKIHIDYHDKRVDHFRRCVGSHFARKKAKGKDLDRLTAFVRVEIQYGKKYEVVWIPELVIREILVNKTSDKKKNLLVPCKS